MEQLAEKGMGTIDMVVVNLYPFIQTIAKEGVTLEDALENIDIGGPTMIRAAAKNFPDVIVVVDPADYGPVLEELDKGKVGLDLRRKLAQKAFQHVAYYDTAIAQYLRGEEKGFPDVMTIALKKRANLSYGENPHQQAAFYEEETPKKSGPSLVSASQFGGKELSFNNILDLESAVNSVMDFPLPTVAIIKHNNPCGLCSNNDLAEAYRRALAGDPLAAFGGVVASNRTIDMATAEEIYKTHYDAIIAPKYADEALALLKRKKDFRIIALGVDLAADQGRTALHGLPARKRRPAGPDSGLHHGEGTDSEDGDQPRAHAAGAGGAVLRLAGGQGHQVQRHRPDQGQDPAGHGRRAAQPRGQRATGAGEGGRPLQGQRAGVGCLLPVPRWTGAGRQGRHHCGDPARRLGEGPGGHQGRQRAQHRHGLHRHPALQALGLPSAKATGSAARDIMVDSGSPDAG